MDISLLAFKFIKHGCLLQQMHIGPGQMLVTYSSNQIMAMISSASMYGMILQKPLNQSFFLTFNQNHRQLIVIIALTWKRILSDGSKLINMKHLVNSSKHVQMICMGAHLFKDCIWHAKHQASDLISWRMGLAMLDTPLGA